MGRGAGSGILSIGVGSGIGMHGRGLSGLGGWTSSGRGLGGIPSLGPVGGGGISSGGGIGGTSLGGIGGITSGRGGIGGGGGFGWPAMPDATSSAVVGGITCGFFSSKVSLTQSVNALLSCLSSAPTVARPMNDASSSTMANDGASCSMYSSRSRALEAATKRDTGTAGANGGGIRADRTYSGAGLRVAASARSRAASIFVSADVSGGRVKSRLFREWSKNTPPVL